MKYHRISVLLTLIFLTTLSVSSLSEVYESARAFVIASWIKPISSICFGLCLSYSYYNTFRRVRILGFIIILIISSVFFVFGFLIFLSSSFLSIQITSSFSGIHAFVLIPSLVSGIIMLLLSLSKRFSFPPLNSSHESISVALFPFYVTIMASIILSLFHTNNAKVRWLTGKYLVKPALYSPIKVEESKENKDIIYAGPLNVLYSMDFIKLYERVKGNADAQTGQDDRIAMLDFAEFSEYYLFTLKEGDSRTLLAFNKKGHLAKRIPNIAKMYHSDSILAAVDTNDRHIKILDVSLKEVFQIPFPPLLEVKKVVFSEELIGLLYTNKGILSTEDAAFSIIYRLDTGNRIGKIKAVDIAPRLKRPGFIAVDNTEKGLYITVLDRNSNKKSYLFKRRKFSNVIINQCGADRFFVRAQLVENQEVKEEYLLVYDFYRYRRLLESTRQGEVIQESIGDIIMVFDKYFLTDSNTLLDRKLQKVFTFKELHNSPYRIFSSPEKSYTVKSEGSIKEIDFKPILEGINKKVRFRTLLADIKGRLIIKKVIKFANYFFAVTNNRIYIYNDNIQLLGQIGFPEYGYIDRIKILETALILTYIEEGSISIYSVDRDLHKSLIALINTKQGKIWDISEDSIIYGQEFRPAYEPDLLKESGILIAKDLNSALMHQKDLLSSLIGSPAIVDNRLFVPYRYLTEIVDLKTRKRTVMNASLLKADDKPYGVTNSGQVINLSTLNAFPYRFDPQKVGPNIYSSGNWIDLHGYLLNIKTDNIYEILRSGMSKIGEDTICSNTKSGNLNIINCLDLTVVKNISTFSVDRDYEIVYSDLSMVFLKDNHSLVAVEIAETKKRN